MTKEQIKTHIKVQINKLVESAEKNGIEICVGSDPEGNGYNTLNSKSLFYSHEKPNKIVLGVYQPREDDELFNLE